MAETTADVRRDIELTRERMSDTLAQLERKLNLTQIVKDHPWPALALAVGAGVLLSGSRADVKAAAATLAATQGTSSRVGTVLDDLVANVMTGVSQAFQQRVEGLVDELKTAIGAPSGGNHGAQGQRNFAGGSAGGSLNTTGAARTASAATPGTTGAATRDFGGASVPSSGGSQGFATGAGAGMSAGSGSAGQSFGGESATGTSRPGGVEGQGGAWGTTRAD